MKGQICNFMADRIILGGPPLETRGPVLILVAVGAHKQYQAHFLYQYHLVSCPHVRSILGRVCFAIFHLIFFFNK